MPLRLSESTGDGVAASGWRQWKGQFPASPRWIVSGVTHRAMAAGPAYLVEGEGGVPAVGTA